MVSILTMIYMCREEEAIKPSHSNVTEAWISYVAAALVKSEIN